MNFNLDIIIDPLRPENNPDFARLNRQWLFDNDLFEEPDEIELADPYTAYVTKGGCAWVAQLNNKVLATCAVVPHSPKSLEIVKLAVDQTVQRQGLARRMVQTCIEYACSKEIYKLVLLSNSRLQAALRLYENMGFQYRPLAVDSKYVSADVYMELDLKNA